MASRNSMKERGYKSMNSTLPTGKESLACKEMPNSEPAAMTGY